MVEYSLVQKLNKVKVNIKTCYIIYSVLRDFNLKSHDDT